MWLQSKRDSRRKCGDPPRTDPAPECYNARMNRLLAVMLLVLVAAAPAARGEAPAAEPWLRASAAVDRDVLPRGAEFRVAVTVDVDKGYHIYANPPSLDFLIPAVVAPEPNPAVRWGEVAYPAGQEFSAPSSGGKSIRVYEGTTIIPVRGTVARDAPLGKTTLRLKLSFQGCDEKSCYQPGERALEVPARIVEATAAVSTTGAARAPAFRAKGEKDLAAMFDANAILALGFLFVAGLVLNLTGCTFPLIPVTMTVFAQQGESRWSKVLPLAIVYVLGLATTFAAVGVIAALAGQSIGFVLQQPVGTLAIVIILAVMMASMFGAFELQLPPALAGRLSARRGYIGAAFMGMVMGAIATPCVGPILASLIAFVAEVAGTASLGKAVLLGALAFFVTGLGLGAPYVLLGLFTGLINRFPRGGGWLIWTKRLMATALAGLILNYLQEYISPEFFWPLVLATFLFAAVYLGLLEGLERRPFTRRFVAVRAVAGLVILAVGLHVYAGATGLYVRAGIAAARPEVAWQPWQPDSLGKARAAGRPTILYFGADWCYECKEWHEKIFADPAVLRESESFARVYADVTHLSAGPLKDFAAPFHGENPPVVVLIDRQGKVWQVLREVPTPAEFLAEMRQAAQADAAK